MIPFWLLCDSLNRERREEPNGDEKKVEAAKTRNSKLQELLPRAKNKKELEKLQA